MVTKILLRILKAHLGVLHEAVVDLAMNLVLSANLEIVPEVILSVLLI